MAREDGRSGSIFADDGEERDDSGAAGGAAARSVEKDREETERSARGWGRENDYGGYTYKDRYWEQYGRKATGEGPPPSRRRSPPSAGGAASAAERGWEWSEEERQARELAMAAELVRQQRDLHRRRGVGWSGKKEYVPGWAQIGPPAREEPEGAVLAGAMGSEDDRQDEERMRRHRAAREARAAAAPRPAEAAADLDVEMADATEEVHAELLPAKSRRMEVAGEDEEKEGKKARVGHAWEETARGRLLLQMQGVAVAEAGKGVPEETWAATYARVLRGTDLESGLETEEATGEEVEELLLKMQAAAAGEEVEEVFTEGARRANLQGRLDEAREEVKARGRLLGQVQQEQEAKRLRFNPPAPPPAVLQPGRWALPEAMRRRADSGALAGRLREENRKVRLTHHMEAGAAPVVDQVWGRIRPETREWMAVLGWNEIATLAALADLDPAGHWMVLRRARGETEKRSYTDLLAKGSTEDAEEFAAFLELVECAGTEVRARRNRVLEPLAPPPVADLPQEVVEERTRAGLLLKQVARARTVKAPKWSGGRVGKQGAGPAKAMTKREKLKAAALAWLRRTLEEMEAPIVKIARASSNPEGIWARAGGGRRPSTLHQRRGAWKKVREYYWTRFRKYWMPGAVYFLDYLNMRAAEPCARSVPVGAIAALAVLEDCGGWEKPDRISLSTVVKGTVRDATGELARRLGLRAIKRASRILVMVEIAMELYQGQAWRLPFKLWWCRIVLAMIWGGLRLSDHGGMPPNEVRYGARGLSAKLLETKTTGPGYRVEELMVWICREAYFVDPSWLEGFAASTKAYATEREFLVTVPKKDFEGHHAEARVDWARGTGLLHALLAELPLPVFDEDAGVWTASPDQKLFTEAAVAGVAHTTVHSPRNAVISRAAMLGWSKDDRRMAARHKPEASEEYVRTQRAITERMQTSIAERVRLHGPGSPDVFDEEAALEDLGKFLEEREVPPEAVKEQLERLRYFDPWRRESTVLAPRARNTPGGAAGGAAVRPELLAVPGEPQTAAATGAPAEGGGADDGEEDEEMDGEKKWSSPAGGLEDLDLSDVELPADPVGYVVTKPRLTLHYVGACWRKPYVDYYAFEEFGLAPDREVQYVRHCSQCWPDGCIEKAPEVKEPEAKEMRNPFNEEPEDDSESDEDGSSGSSSPSPDEEDGTMEE